ncbi:MAG: hypothetical protein Q9209_001095 [Squamulea sp. 1 TL-2023]
MGSNREELMFIDVANSLSRLGPAGHSKVNYGNAQVIRDYVEEMNDDGVEASKIVVVAFFQAQVTLLRSMIQNNGSDTKGCSQVCLVDEFAGRQSDVLIVDFVLAVSQNKFNLQNPNPTALCPPVDAFMNGAQHIHTITMGARDGLTYVGQFAHLVAGLFEGGQVRNPLFCLAEDLYHRNLIVSEEAMVDPDAVPGWGANNRPDRAMMERCRRQRHAFIQAKITRGRQQLGIVRNTASTVS